jgi:hypothetical protein
MRGVFKVLGHQPSRLDSHDLRDAIEIFLAQLALAVLYLSATHPMGNCELLLAPNACYQQAPSQLFVR